MAPRTQRAQLGLCPYPIRGTSRPRTNATARLRPASAPRSTLHPTAALAPWERPLEDGISDRGIRPRESPTRPHPSNRRRGCTRPERHVRREEARACLYLGGVRRRRPARPSTPQPHWPLGRRDLRAKRSRGWLHRHGCTQTGAKHRNVESTSPYGKHHRMHVTRRCGAPPRRAPTTQQPTTCHTWRRRTPPA